MGQAYYILHQVSASMSVSGPKRAEKKSPSRKTKSRRERGRRTATMTIRALEKVSVGQVRVSSDI
jgi:hypothetical protein